MVHWLLCFSVFVSISLHIASHSWSPTWFDLISEIFMSPHFYSKPSKRQENIEAVNLLKFGPGNRNRETSTIFLWSKKPQRPPR